MAISKDDTPGGRTPAGRLYANLAQLPPRDLGGSVCANTHNIIGMRKLDGSWATFASEKACASELMGWLMRAASGKHPDYPGKKKLDTVGKLMKAYCPGADSSYMRILREGTGLSLDHKLDIGNKKEVMSLAAAIIAKESGGHTYRYSMNTLSGAYDMAADKFRKTAPREYAKYFSAPGGGAQTAEARPAAQGVPEKPRFFLPRSDIS